MPQGEATVSSFLSGRRADCIAAPSFLQAEGESFDRGQGRLLLISKNGAPYADASSIIVNPLEPSRSAHLLKVAVRDAIPPSPGRFPWRKTYSHATR
jgi:hypothetical protein